MPVYIDPDREHWAAFKALPRDTPIHMLNMIRYCAKADYLADHPFAGRGLTGEEAFAEYVARFVPFVEAMGGGMIWDERFETVVTGPPEREWDRVFVMGYPHVGAFMAMVTDPAYKAEMLPHRRAAVADSRLVRYAPVAKSA